MLAPCPDLDVIRSMVDGERSADEVEAVAVHLELCSACALAAEQMLPAGNTFADAFAAATHPNDELAERALIDRLQSLHPANETVTLDVMTRGDQQGNGDEAATLGYASSSTDVMAEARTMLAPAQAPDELGRLGPYRVLKLLGAGGMGLVLQAEDTQLDRLVALKVMRRTAAEKPSARQRFLREARAAAKVKHGHIVTIHSVGEDHGVPYLATELLEGEPLDSRVQRTPSLTLPEILRIGRETAAGLAAAHQRGLIHRDIKPANLWLETSVENGKESFHTKILDFGLARAAGEDEHLTQSGLIVGTPAYMAPEQAHGGEIDHRCDLFSLGVVLYRLCTGKLPFAGKTTMAVLAALATHTPATPREINPDVPAPVSDLIMKLLQRDPTRRFGSAQEVEQAIARLEANLTAPPAVTVPDVPPPAPRSRRGLLLGTVGVFALIIASIVLYWQTPYGTVRIEILDKDITAHIDKDGAEIVTPGEQRIRLEPGQHGFVVRRGDFSFKTDKLTLTKGDTITLRIDFHEGKVRVLKEGEVWKEASPPARAAPRYALDFNFEADGQYANVCPPKGLDASEPCTVELIVTPRSIEPKNAGLFFIGNGLAISNWSRHLTWGSTGIDTKNRLVARDVMVAGQRTHIAAVFTGQELRLFVNGHQVGQAPVLEPIPRGLEPARLGGTKARKEAKPFDGLFHEFRFSKTVRYDKDFTPLERMVADKDAFIFYDFQEGDGDLLHDRSGNGHHGKIMGAKWVKLEESTSPLTTPVQIPEPPPLAEWLKGREILTVSQDGKGQFKTIQAALNSLKPGQAVKVLGRGPYRESLNLYAVPADTGLISDQRTIIELPNWDNKVGHYFRAADGFRLHGFSFVAPPAADEKTNLLAWGGRPAHLVIEDCHFRRSIPEGRVYGDSALHIDAAGTRLTEGTVWLRDCFFESGRMQIFGEADRAMSLVIERCYFHASSGGGSCALGAGGLRNVVVRGSIFRKHGPQLAFVGAQPLGLEISNNTILGPGTQFQVVLPERGVTIRNNIILWGVYLLLGAEKQKALAVANWQTDHNCYLEYGKHPEDHLPKASSDCPEEPPFLSKDPNHRELARIPSDCQAATQGAGGAWPKYVGALPPGPAPKDGDWFTRLRERWYDVQPANSEPPSLTEWLKGRTTLTVSQNGNGQFKTIQAALDALQAGQVVEILDHGPYRETLVASPPRNTGMVSRHPQGTIIVQNGRPPGRGWEVHQFMHADGFRLHGFEFRLGESDRFNEYHRVVDISTSTNVVIEHCFFPDMRDKHYALTVEGTSGTVRECRFDWRLGINLGADSAKHGITVERCWFRRSTSDQRIEIQGSSGTVRLHANVFEGGPYAVVVNAASLDSLEVNSNSFFGGGVWATDRVRFSQAQVRNNILEMPIRYDGNAASPVASAVRRWQVDGNSYATAPIDANAIPNGSNDLVVRDPNFLSRQPADPNYLRPTGDSLLAKGGYPWPSRIGALPAGPAPEDGDWFTQLRLRWKIPLDDPPLSIAEPLPLAQWLKGREILTVSQDGKGQFKTIQAALDVLKPGQAVKVLDRGPYRESLLLNTPPKDVGLISECQTEIELTGWHPVEDPNSKDRLGHRFFHVQGFRLSGFAMKCRLEPNCVGNETVFSQCRDVVVENCAFLPPAAAKDADNYAPMLITWWKEDVKEPIVVRDCFLTAGRLVVFGHSHSGPLHIVRNYLDHGANVQIHGKAIRQAVVRSNVLGNEAAGLIFVDLGDAPEAVEISNNTIICDGSQFSATAPLRNVTIRNNILKYGYVLGGGAEKRRESVLANWRLGNNSFVNEAIESSKFFMQPRHPSDLPGKPAFLSNAPAERDYLRIALDSPPGCGGACGAWPSYIGALSPGAAPNEGDWFTQLRERWCGLAPKIQPPIRIPEPPPLAEWLKGRTILTVSQDGKSQFKTIQEALNALQPGQVVKVLDKGPYRERLEVTVPPDAGLVSESATVLELAKWEVLDKNPNTGEDTLKGHVLQGVNGFRLHGLKFVLTGAKKSADRGIIFLSPGGLVLEKCWFAAGEQCEVNIGAGEHGNIKPNVIRECRFEASLLIEAPQDFNAMTMILERNYFNLQKDLRINRFVRHVTLYAGENSPFKRVVIRHNVFAGRADCDILLGAKELAELEISNNTLLSSAGVCVNTAPLGTVTIRNNLRGKPAILSLPEGDEKAMVNAQRTWRVGHNSYPRWQTLIALQTLFPKAPDDVLAAPRFLSADAQESNYLRLPTDDPLARAGSGGAWPTHLGALPPGPAPKDGDWFTRLRERWASADKPPADKDKPFVLVRGSKPAVERKTLHGIIAELQPGDVVEIHGNGPFKLGQLDAGRNGLTLRAAPGYRPRFEMDESAIERNMQATYWWTVRGDLTIEGCDLVGAAYAGFFDHGGGKFHLRRCRILRCHSLTSSKDSTEILLEDCLIMSFHGLTTNAAKVEVCNCVTISGNFLVEVETGAQVRLHGNSMYSASGLVVINPRPGGAVTTVEMAHNVAMLDPMASFPALLAVRDDDWQPHVRWQGHDNLYVGDWGPPRIKGPKGTPWTARPADLAAWNKIVEAEPGTRQVKNIAFAWSQTDGPASGDMSKLAAALAQERRALERAGVGPDLTMLGPGDAYVRALEKAAGMPIPKNQIRVEAEEGGPFVLLRSGKVVRGFDSLKSAFDACQNDDVIEIRTDEPRPSAVLRAGKSNVTIRAGPGYRPVLTGDTTVQNKSSIALEGLSFTNNVGADVNGQITRLVNCETAGYVSLWVGENATEIIRSAMKRLVLGQRDGARAVVRGCVLNVIEFQSLEGDSTLSLERCALWRPELGYAIKYYGTVPKGTISIDARDTMFEAGHMPLGPLPLRWQGSGNVYRLGSLNLQFGTSAYGLSEWRKIFESTETGSVASEPLISDPGMWRILTPEFARLNVGADPSRIAGPSPPLERRDAADKPLADKDKPFVLVRGGKPVAERASLNAALNDLEPGDIIEVHGNGPFSIRGVRLDGKLLHLRAGAGYRPRFVANAVISKVHKAYLFQVSNAPLTIEGCDIECLEPNASLALLGGTNPGPWRITGCRLLLGSSGVGSLLHYVGPRLSVTDSLLVHEFSHDGIELGEKVEAEFTNNIIASDASCIFYLLGAGRQKLVLRNNSFSGWHFLCLRPSPGAVPPTIDVDGNVFATRSLLRISGMEPAAARELFQKMTWRGRDNLYAIPTKQSLADSQLDQSPFTVLAKDWQDWNKIRGGPEPGSRQVEAAQFFFSPPPRRSWEDAVTNLQEPMRAAGVGPHWPSVGAGRANEFAPNGKRPKKLAKPNETSFMLVRQDAEVAGFATLNAAWQSAQAGDTIEIHVEKVSEDLRPGERKRLTIRAAPDCRPVLTGRLVPAPGDEWALEGLVFRNCPIGHNAAAGTVRRLTNCVVEGETREAFTFGFSIPAGETIEIKNSVLPAQVDVLAEPGAKLRIINSVVGRLQVYAAGEAGDTPCHITLENSLVWPERTALTTAAKAPKALTVDARQCWFEAPQMLMTRQTLVVWNGVKNVYANQGARQLIDTTANPMVGLPAWRERFKSDADSIEVAPLYHDPRQWRLIGGEKFGADPARIAITK